VDTISLDYETKSEIDLKQRGLDVYSAHPSTRILMGAYSFNDGGVKHWEGPTLPTEVREALEDPGVQKWAFNAQFERVISRRVGKVKTRVKNWRCSMVLAYMHSFVGDLDRIGQQVGLDEDKQKQAQGKRLINLFCKPQKITKNQRLEWFDEMTHPVDWADFCDYNCQDVVAEKALVKRLIRFPIPPEEWELYEIDQIINDRGIPIDMQFVRNAIGMVARRKEELRKQAQEVTGLANPFSNDQLLPWLRARGYPFNDLQKATVLKVLNEHKEGVHEIAEEAEEALQIRRQGVRTSTAKYNALVKCVGHGDRFRFGIQFAGASRTSRWSGRRFQPHNLVRTPKEIEDEYNLTNVTDIIRSNDYSTLSIYVEEIMNALAGAMRSAVRAGDDEVLLACDLAAIETCVIAWIANCLRMLNVIRSGLDPYKDFGTELYKKTYDDITKTERTNSKPAVLGAGYRLSGGELKEGKRTGLWGYAESMQIQLTKDESHLAVKLFRETYPEYPKLWYALENAAMHTIKTGRAAIPKFRIDGREVTVPLRFEWNKPYLEMRLPSGRALRYHKPRVIAEEMPGRIEGTTYTKQSISYMGQPQGTRMWKRLPTHGGKFTENAVQAIARDVLAVAMRRAHDDGFNIVMHVHDELVALQKKGDNYFTAERLRGHLIAAIDWCLDLPLGSSASEYQFYRKD
jgi:DNA polymerase